ncbi:hypothetical protein [Helicobacter sp. MIT 01-3238]|uniref:hypothetical protein n=1 Tax=Helicobacter sp. MIT 01-3238 TaxID=398627 RepID=UPI0015F1AB97|nr:hypothetical protein [Helicobacter sp. MIT 01-3238]
MVTYAFIVIASEQSERGNPQKKERLPRTLKRFSQNKRSAVSLENKRSAVSLAIFY